MNKRSIQSGDVVFITGAGGGIGRATAEEFAAKGAVVVATDRDIDAVIETAEIITGSGGRCEAIPLDVTNEGQWLDVVDDVCTRYGVPRVVVNNAGYATAGRFLDHSASDWASLIDVNVRGVVTGARLFGKRMVDAGVKGQITNIASGAAYAIMPVSSPYCTTKAAVLMFSRVLSMELGHHGIGVTAICPGVVASNFAANLHHLGVRENLADVRRQKSVGIAARFGTRTDTVAKAVVRSVGRKRTASPVSLESRIAYVLVRVSPAAMRLIAAGISWDFVRILENTWMARLLSGVDRKASK